MGLDMYATQRRNRGESYRLRRETEAVTGGPRSIGLIKRETLSRSMLTNFRGLR